MAETLVALWDIFHTQHPSDSGDEGLGSINLELDLPGDGDLNDWNFPVNMSLVIKATAPPVKYFNILMDGQILC